MTTENGEKEAGGGKDEQVRLPPGVSHPIDIHVGQRLRARRTLMGLTQEELAAAVSLTFQQIQKYERGTNRIGASRLYELAGLLHVPVGYFFEEMQEELGDPAAGYRLGMAFKEQARPGGNNKMNRRETLELVRAYYQIADPAKREALMGMVLALANASDRHRKDG